MHIISFVVPIEERACRKTDLGGRDYYLNPHLNPVSTPVSCSSNQHDTVVFKMSNNLGCSSNKQRNISNGHIKIDLMNIKNSSNECKKKFN